MKAFFISLILFLTVTVAAESMSEPERLWQNRGAKSLEILKKLDDGARCKKMLESSFAPFGALETAKKNGLIKNVDGSVVKVTWAILNEKRDGFGVQINFMYPREGKTATPMVALHSLGKGWSVWVIKNLGITQILSEKCSFTVDQSDPLKTVVDDRTF